MMLYHLHMHTYYVRTLLILIVIAVLCKDARPTKHHEQGRPVYFRLPTHAQRIYDAERLAKI